MSKSCNSLYNRNSSSIIQDRTDYDKHMITLFSTPECSAPVYGPGGQAPQHMLAGGPGGTLKPVLGPGGQAPKPMLGPGGTLKPDHVAVANNAIATAKQNPTHHNIDTVAKAVANSVAISLKKH